MTVARAVSSSSRMWRALAGPTRLRDKMVLFGGALLSATLIFGLLYDVVDGAIRRWSDRDVSRRAHLIVLAVEPSGLKAPSAQLQTTLASLAGNEDVGGLVVCFASGARLGAGALASGLDCNSAVALAATRTNGHAARGTIGDRRVLVNAHQTAGQGTLFVIHDRTLLDARRKHVLQALFVAAELVLLALLLLARAGARIGSRRTEEAARSMMQRMRSGDASDEPVPPHLRLLVRDMQETMEQARHEKTDVEEGGAARLREFARGEIQAGGLVVIANREPYSHEWAGDGSVVVKRPASGLVTAIEPVLRACGGTWIACGSGTADRAHSDASGRLSVPPQTPEYTLRRMWIEDAEYERYYSGLANEGLWPLCHMAHAQPIFRSPDWSAYEAVNETFASAAVEEATTEGLVLIQDYHFALVPRMIRSRAPHLITNLFWHIPWPHSEVVGICPWKEMLLEGMLGADVVGFHTARYCLNFVESAQRYLECRFDPEEMSITHGGHKTLVRAYPISVEWPYPAAAPERGVALRDALGISADVHVSLGVDRADYTKGLVERVDAVELLLEQNPSLLGKFVFVQLASPTRTRIPRYQQVTSDLHDAVDRVNARFGTAEWKPVLLQVRTFSPEEVREYYRMADSALVTPLHDGMNLVAKEYVAACDDGDGVLVLSVFAGAAKELEGALLVNPYDTQQMAEAILRAVRMPLSERRGRMQGMREQIAGHSIYDWSKALLTDMREIRLARGRFWPQRSVPARPAPRQVVAG